MLHRDSETGGTQTPAIPNAQYTRDGALYLPTRHSMGYWVDNTLNGSAVASLMALVLEQRYAAPGFVPARYIVDLLGMAHAEPIAVETEILREGGRLKLVEARIIQRGQLMARASLQLLRATEAPLNPTWQSPPWNAPHPETLPSSPHHGPWDLRPIPAAMARTKRTAPEGVVAGASNVDVLAALAPVPARQTWLKINRMIVDGVPHTPFTRLAMAGDFSSPIVHSSEAGIDYVNTDFSIYIHRPLVDEWIGYEQVGHTSADGLAIGECWIHDLAGPLGTINLSALAQKRRR